MLREISEEVRVNLKDRLREVRQSIRGRRHDAPMAAGRVRAPFPFDTVDGLLGHAVSAFDDVMTMAETLSPHRLGRSTAPAMAQPFGAYFPARDKLAGERLFRRDLYALAKSTLAARGRAGSTVSETSLAAVHTAFSRQQAGALADLARATAWADRVALAASLSAALMVELMHHQPLRFAEGAVAAASGADRDMAIACLAPVALTCGLATMEAENPPETDLLEISTLAVDARIERIHAALDGKDAHGELTALFATLLAHLP